MTDTAALAGLDEVLWAAVKHAYGPAVDVPALLRALRSASADVRSEAWHELRSSIIHQGSRYPATRYAVPFLARPALDPATPDRAEIPGFLGALAIGHDTAHFPRYDPAGQRRQLAELRDHTAASWERLLDDWVDDAVNEAARRTRERRRQYWTLEASLRDAEASLGAYEAVRAELPQLRTMLDDLDAEVRAATAYLLAWFPEEAAGSTPALAALLDAESSTRVAINAIIAFGMVAEPGTASRLRKYLTGDDRALAWAAAIGLAAAGAADQQVIDLLATALAEAPFRSEEEDHGLLFIWGTFDECASKSLARIDGELVPYALDAVLHVIASTDSRFKAHAAISAAAALAFPGSAPKAHPTFADLDQLQQRFLRALTDLGPAVWRGSNSVRLILQPHGLPISHDDLLEYLELAPARHHHE